MVRSLKLNDIRSIFIWLKEHELDFDSAKMHRDFSDGVNVAKILKSVYPKLVDMNNYPKCNSIILKLKNWETLNYKVLRKIGLNIRGKHIMRIAQCKPGAIEPLLHRIMIKEIEYRRALDNTISLQEQIWMENDDVLTVNVKRLVDGEFKEGPEKLILFSIYDEALKQSEALSIEIIGLKQRIEHLENIRKLKIEHVGEIHKRLSKMQVNGLKEQAPKAGIPPLDLRGIEESSSSSDDTSTITETGEISTV